MTTTREQRLRELVSQWKRECMVFADMPNSVPVPKRLYLWNRIDELAAILAEPVDVSEEMVANALLARVPGGARVWHWLPSLDGRAPHPTAVDVIRTALTAALKEPGQ
jgi:hypothetical protein